eukprot:4906805-Prymnesium_polylepis.1
MRKQVQPARKVASVAVLLLAHQACLLEQKVGSVEQAALPLRLAHAIKGVAHDRNQRVEHHDMHDELHHHERRGKDKPSDIRAGFVGADEHLAECGEDASAKIFKLLVLLIQASVDKQHEGETACDQDDEHDEEEVGHVAKHLLEHGVQEAHSPIASRELGEFDEDQDVRDAGNLGQPLGLQNEAGKERDVDEDEDGVDDVVERREVGPPLRCHLEHLLVEIAQIDRRRDAEKQPS